MENLFFTVLGMSGTASVVILVVLLARLVLRRAPKVFSYVLWTVVLFRLLCPFTFSSPWGIAPVRVEPAEAKHPEASTSTAGVVIRVDNPPVSHSEPLVTFTPQEPPSILDTPELDAPVPAAAPAALSWRTVVSLVWLTGVLLLLGYSAASLLLLRRRLIGSVPLAGEKNVRLADHIPSPFVLGLARPRIYLPSDLPESERDYILLHERTHIRRFDHVTRALAWIALSVHWFNPLVWLAFHLAGKDMEMSCDEAVLRKMGRDIRADYSTSLLRLSVGGKLPAGPLAFGDGDPQKRIRNVLNYKKPAFWVVAAALISVLCAGVALATNQSGLTIDPDSIVSATLFNSSSCTHVNGTIIYTPDDLSKDLLEPADARALSLEDGRELVRLINTYHKTVYGQGKLTLNTPDQRFTRLDCADGSFYLVNYWYWHGFNFNPFHGGGEDDYTTLVTYYDAEGNAGTTWQMEYDFDEAFHDWYYPIIRRREEAPRFSLEELADSLNADLTFTLHQSDDSAPYVIVKGNVGGMTLDRPAIWAPEVEYSLFVDGPQNGELTMEYIFASGGAALGAWWTDDTHTSITVSSRMSTYYSSYKPDGWWEFTVDLATDTLTSLVSHPMESTLSAPVKLYPESFKDEEPVQAARIMAVVMWAAEDYYTQNAPETPTLALTYSMYDYRVGISGLDCDGMLWNPVTRHRWAFGGLSLPDYGMLGILTIDNPRFFGGRFADAKGTATVAYFPNERSPLLFVGFCDYVPPDVETGRMTTDATFFIVDLTSGVVATLTDVGYDLVDSGLSGAEKISLARTLTQVIQGAADFYAPDPDFYLLPTYSLDGDGTGVTIGNLDCSSASWQFQQLDAPFDAPEHALGYLSLWKPTFLGENFTKHYMSCTALYSPYENLDLVWLTAYDIAEDKVMCCTVDLRSGNVTDQELTAPGYEGVSPKLSNEEMVQAATLVAGLIEDAWDYYFRTSPNAPLRWDADSKPPAASPAPASTPQPTASVPPTAAPTPAPTAVPEPKPADPAPSGTPTMPYVPAPDLPGSLIFSSPYSKCGNDFRTIDFDAVPSGGKHIRFWFKNLTDQPVWVYLRRCDLLEGEGEYAYEKIVRSVSVEGNTEGYADYYADDADTGTYYVWIQSRIAAREIIEGGTYVSQY